MKRNDFHPSSPLQALAQHSFNIRLVREDEWVTSVKLRDPFHWTVNVRSHRLGLRPDKAFGLENTTTGDKAFYFLEADRATMPIIRQNLSQSSFHRKPLAYEATWKQNIHRSRFGFHRFRVLTVTTSAERAKHLLEASRRLESGHGMFLFTDAKTLRDPADFFSVLWRTSRDGKTARLFD